MKMRLASWCDKHSDGRRSPEPDEASGDLQRLPDLPHQQFDLDGSMPRWIWLLHFPPAVEADFLRSRSDRLRRSQLFTLLIGLILYNAFLLATDRTTIPDIYAKAAVLRLCVVTPVALIGILLHWRRSAPLLLELTSGLASFAAAASLIYFQIETRSLQGSAYFIGSPLIIVYLNIMQRVRFWLASAISAMILLLNALCLPYVVVIPRAVYAVFFCATAIIAVMTLIANHRLERQERYQYLLEHRDRLQREREHELLAQLQDRNNALDRLANFDPLTGLPNRHYLNSTLSEQWLRARRDGVAMGCLMIDVDHFKAYNDHYGHVAGDRALQLVAEAIRSNIRSTDFVARYGGEEFVALLSSVDEGNVQTTAERICEGVRAAMIEHATSPIQPFVTVSVGGVTLSSVDAVATQTELLREADRSLYEAKGTGRNRWIVHHLPHSPDPQHPRTMFARADNL